MDQLCRCNDRSGTWLLIIGVMKWGSGHRIGSGNDRSMLVPCVSTKVGLQANGSWVWLVAWGGVLFDFQSHIILANLRRCFTYNESKSTNQIKFKCARLIKLACHLTKCAFSLQSHKMRLLLAAFVLAIVIASCAAQPQGEAKAAAARASAQGVSLDLSDRTCNFYSAAQNGFSWVA